jgi:hypothetical protein
MSILRWPRCQFFKYAWLGEFKCKDKNSFKKIKTKKRTVENFITLQETKNLLNGLKQHGDEKQWT